MSRFLLVLRWLGDQVYGIFISLGWQPSERSEQQDENK